MNKTKFAIGCLVQWYEVKIISEYIYSLKKAVDIYGKENILIYFDIIQDQILEKFDGSEEEFEELLEELMQGILTLESQGYSICWECHSKSILTKAPFSIADHRREFNNNFCEVADVLIWGESDMLVPKQMFTVLDHLHQQVKDTTPKYISFFGGCKMWDESWKMLEHPKFTDKPFIEGDTKNWWSLRYTMSEEEMNEINNETEEVEVITLPQHKFNGCGLVISSEVIKAGANIPKGMFFVHEDTAFMNMTNKILGNIPQYVIRNILLVHNRKHHSKRYKVKGEAGIDPTNTGKLRMQHQWYKKAHKASSENLINLFNPGYRFKTWNNVL